MKGAFWLLKIVLLVPVVAVMVPACLLFAGSFWVFQRIGAWGER